MPLRSETIGSRGNKVRLYEARAGGPIMRAIWINGKENRKSLGHRDWKLARKQAKELVAALMADEVAAVGGTITLTVLFALYLESEHFKAKKPLTQMQDRQNLERVIRIIGPNRLIDSLGEEDVLRYGRVRAGERVATVAPRTLAKELTTLRTLLNWGTRQKDQHGRKLVRENPLAGVKLPKEQNPRRPIASREDFDALMAVADGVHRLLPAALVLAEATGRRISAIRQLQWADVSLERGSIRWRADNDKMGLDRVIPMSERVEVALRAIRPQDAQDTDWVFPAPKSPGKPCTLWVLHDWLCEAYRRAGLARPPRKAWHAFRRKWATDRKELPAPDVAEAGGWKSPATLQNVYQRADAETIREVVLFGGN